MNPAESKSELAAMIQTASDLAATILNAKGRCPACTEKRLHAAAEWAHHPWAGHGYQNGQGWSHPELAYKTQDAGAETSLGIISGEVAQAATAPADMAQASATA